MKNDEGGSMTGDKLRERLVVIETLARNGPVEDVVTDEIIREEIGNEVRAALTLLKTQRMSTRVFDGMVYAADGCPKKLDCGALARVASADFESFMCCGEPAEETRSVPNDRFRLCIYSEHETGVDLMVNLDERDVIDTVSVLMHALSYDAQATKAYPEDE